MKPFDLEAAKRGDQIVIRDGREAKFIAYVPEMDSDSRVLFRVDKTIFTSDDEGHVSELGNRSDYDLFMAPKKRTVWVNLWHSGHYDARDTEAAADDVAYTTFGERVGGKAYPVEIEE